MTGRLTLGLYNSYDARKFHEAHRRALVRAAPLALAFEANLATFGFPYDELAANDGRVVEARSKKDKAAKDFEPPVLKTPLDIATFVAAGTSVGGDGAYFVDLAQKGRFQVFDLPKKGFPPQLGTVVLTTEHAKGPKETNVRNIAREMVEGRSQLLIMGLGPHGTPPEVREVAQWEWDVTGGNYGLETATAMGALVASIRAHVEMLGG